MFLRPRPRRGEGRLLATVAHESREDRVSRDGRILMLSAAAAAAQPSSNQATSFQPARRRVDLAQKLRVSAHSVAEPRSHPEHLLKGPRPTVPGRPRPSPALPHMSKFGRGLQSTESRDSISVRASKQGAGGQAGGQAGVRGPRGKSASRNFGSRILSLPRKSPARARSPQTDMTAMAAKAGDSKRLKNNNSSRSVSRSTHRKIRPAKLRSCSSM